MKILLENKVFKYNNITYNVIMGTCNSYYNSPFDIKFIIQTTPEASDIIKANIKLKYISEARQVFVQQANDFKADKYPEYNGIRKPVNCSRTAIRKSYY